MKIERKSKGEEKEEEATAKTCAIIDYLVLVYLSKSDNCVSC